MRYRQSRRRYPSLYLFCANHRLVRALKGPGPGNTIRPADIGARYSGTIPEHRLQANGARLRGAGSGRTEIARRPGIPTTGVKVPLRRGHTAHTLRVERAFIRETDSHGMFRRNPCGFGTAVMHILRQHSSIVVGESIPHIPPLPLGRYNPLVFQIFYVRIDCGFG